MSAVVIRGARVADGTGAPLFEADLRIEDDRIAEVGDVRANGVEEIDATGLVLAPGLIDVHTHDDLALIRTPNMLPKISQGVTTVIAGNCGLSLPGYAGPQPEAAPFGLFRDAGAYRFATVIDWSSAVRAAAPAVNVAILIGHSTLRAVVMDLFDRPATDAEIAQMIEHARRNIEEGAIGLSSGLAYPAAHAAPEAEVTALLSGLADLGGIYTTHLRDERAGVVEAVAEALRTSASAGLRLVISHHKCMGRSNHGLVNRTLPMIDAAADVALDVYPYTASSTILNPDVVEDAEQVLISASLPHPEAIGRDLDDIAADWGIDRRTAAERLCPGGAIYFQMDEADLRRVMSHPRCMIGSDGIPADSHPHPRLWGTFPRVLGRYARDACVLSLETAIHRMTGLAADSFGLAGRGRITEGAFADLVLFDPETVIDRADFDRPMRPSDGIVAVFVNGVLSFLPEQGSIGRAGRVLTDRRRVCA